MNTLNKKELYNILGVDPSCSKKELKTAFRKLAAQHHPDKGGDVEIFKKMKSAFELLSSDKESNLPTRQSKPQDDWFNSMFGGKTGPYKRNGIS